MAIYLEFYSIIMRVSTIEERYPGGFAAFVASRADQFAAGEDDAPALWHDDHLCRVGGTMSPEDVDAVLADLAREMPITVLRQVDGQPHFEDVYVSGSYQGAAYPCQWIQEGDRVLDRGLDETKGERLLHPVEFAYLAGTAPGRVVPLE